MEEEGLWLVGGRGWAVGGPWIYWYGGALCKNRPGFGKRAMILER